MPAIRGSGVSSLAPDSRHRRVVPGSRLASRWQALWRVADSLSGVSQTRSPACRRLALLRVADSLSGVSSLRFDSPLRRVVRPPIRRSPRVLLMLPPGRCHRQGPDLGRPSGSPPNEVDVGRRRRGRAARSRAPLPRVSARPCPHGGPPPMRTTPAWDRCPGPRTTGGLRPAGAPLRLERTPAQRPSGPWHAACLGSRLPRRRRTSVPFFTTVRGEPRPAPC